MSIVALGARGAVSAGAMRLRRRPLFAPEKVPNCGVMTAQGVVLERSCDQSPMNRIMCRSWGRRACKLHVTCIEDVD